MINHSWHSDHSVLEVRPSGPLQVDDFHSLAAQIDPLISEHGCLAGLLINAQDFAGWKSFAALVSHCVFVRDHHSHIRKIAVVSDNALLGFMPRLVDHFISAEVRPFPASEYRLALDWLAEAG